jgi:hypothetical protein
MKKAEFPIPVTIRMSPEQVKWLRREAEDREVWVSDIIRDLIDGQR